MANDKATVNHSYEDWYKTIMGYERSYKRWEARVDRIVKKYKDDSRYDRNPNARFNILWSNVQTIQPAIFARLPRPDVSRRFRDKPRHDWTSHGADAFRYLSIVWKEEVRIPQKDDSIKGLSVGQNDVSLNDMWKQNPVSVSRGRI